MNIHIFHTTEAFDTAAANIIIEQIAKKPSSILGLPTGKTPSGMYQQLVNAYHAGMADFSQTITFNLDEYIALQKNDENSYYSFMQRNLFSHINIKQENIHLPNGNAEDLIAECKNYDTALAACGGIDLQVLGTGVNGHIGFNEPAAALNKNTHVTALTKQTIASNCIYFNTPQEMPNTAITIGLGVIFAAKKILLLAKGENKAKVIKKLCDGEISTQVPVTLLNLHQDVTVMLDNGAASLL